MALTVLVPVPASFKVQPALSVVMSVVFLAMLVVLPATVVLLVIAVFRLAVLTLYFTFPPVTSDSIMFPSPTNVTVWLPVLSAFTVCAGLVPSAILNLVSALVMGVVALLMLVMMSPVILLASLVLSMP